MLSLRRQIAVLCSITLTVLILTPVAAAQAAPKVTTIKCVAVPEKNFTAVTGLAIPKLLKPLPVIGKLNVSDFGSAACAATAFLYVFAFLYKANKIPDIWSPNLNRDPGFIPKLRVELMGLAPYFGGVERGAFSKDLGMMVGSVGGVAARNEVGLWRDLFMIPERLTNGTLPPPSKAADDLEAVAPWDLGASVEKPTIISGTVSSPVNAVGLKISFTWSSNLVFGTTKRIKEYSSLTRRIFLIVISNPKGALDPQHPYLIVGWGVTKKAAFGKVMGYDRPLVAPPVK